MTAENAPVVGAVYEDDEGESFEVIAFDPAEGVVEIEYEDGSVDEIDIDSWYGLNVERISDAEEEDEEDQEEEEEYDDYEDDDEDYDDDDDDDDYEDDDDDDYDEDER